MNVAFITEMNFTTTESKVSRTHSNMRTEFAWMCALKADHYHYSSFKSITGYDLVIVIIPKKNINNWRDLPIIDTLKENNRKVGTMQEGPNWYFQDYSLPEQVWYYNTLRSADILFVHNTSDIKYFKGLTAHSDVRVLPSLMIEDSIGTLEDVKRDYTIIGGNFVSWYGGFDSFIVAQEFEVNIFAPSMGRKQPGEEQLVTHLPYMQWRDWIHSLNNFKYGVHLMRTHAAGTFALNCAYLGIPCIGYKGLDTQELCFPSLTVEVGDLISAKKLAHSLKTDSSFYKEQSIFAKEQYVKHFSEEQFLIKFNL